MYNNQIESQLTHEAVAFGSQRKSYVKVLGTIQLFLVRIAVDTFITRPGEAVLCLVIIQPHQ